MANIKDIRVKDIGYCFMVQIKWDNDYNHQVTIHKKAPKTDVLSSLNSLLNKLLEDSKRGHI